ncbi:hypothetical protein ACETK8_18665 [Brevundimonas staleyi]|uniref:Uncharacterized protein n=1 Tax=Brevundimonas staleyi TaxID=74326 RepID=A0ABW0FRT7_9CAUL
MDPITSIVASMLISGAAAPADGHGCAEAPHYGDVPCACTRVVDFYGPWTGGGYTPPGGWPPPINVPAGPAIHVAAPGVRVIARPVNVAGPVIYIDGPPVYVDAPPIRIAPAQIYVQRPDVVVRPSEVLVEPPQVHFSDCADGTVCTPVDGVSGSYGAGAAPAGGSAVLSSRVSPPPPPPAPVHTAVVDHSDEHMPVYETTPPPVLEPVAPSSGSRVPPPVPFYPPKQDRN